MDLAQNMLEPFLERAPLCGESRSWSFTDFISRDLNCDSLGSFANLIIGLPTRKRDIPSSIVRARNDY